MMNGIDTQRFNEVQTRFDAGDYEEALGGLRDLARGIDDPWDKAELLYHECLFLIEMDKIQDARQQVVALDNALASLVESPQTEMSLMFGSVCR